MKRGFTTIELLVVIAILLILMGIVIGGMSHMRKTAHGNHNKILLNNLQSMLAEFETTGTPLPSTGTFIPSPGDVSEEQYSSSTDSMTVAEPEVSRWKSDAVVFTQGVIGRLKSVTNNRTPINDMPRVKMQLGGAAYTATTPDALHPIKTQRSVGSDGKTLKTPGYGEPTPPIPADSYNNPIIYVPASGLNVALAFDGKARSYKVGTIASDGATFYRALKPGATEAQKGDKTVWEVLPTTYSPVVTSPGHRPFWASAGPDGDFHTQDDNEYSFGD